MPENINPNASAFPLKVIKTVHTVVWVFFATCILAIPMAASLAAYQTAVWCSITVLVEVLVLVFNRLRCPLTALAERYTVDRSDNFDIYLPLWLARYNKIVFGSLYVAGITFAVMQWVRVSG
jgi:hypothetical protein